MRFMIRVGVRNSTYNSMLFIEVTRKYSISKYAHVQNMIKCARRNAYVYRINVKSKL